MTVAFDFPLASFVHFPREANAVAHELENLTKGPSCNSFLDEPPNVLIPLLLNDATLIAM